MTCVINEVIGRNNDKPSTVDCFKITKIQMLLTKELFDSNSVLSLQMLVNICLMLSISLVIICVAPKHAITHNMLRTPTDPNEIGKYIDSLKNKNSSGHDEVTSTFLKSVKSAVVQPLSILINKSLETGIVPDKLILAKVIPIYKSKDKQLLNNYRPPPPPPPMVKAVLAAAVAWRV